MVQANRPFGKEVHTMNRYLLTALLALAGLVPFGGGRAECESAATEKVATYACKYGPYDYYTACRVADYLEQRGYSTYIKRDSHGYYWVYAY
jgi:hypothetical protein